MSSDFKVLNAAQIRSDLAEEIERFRKKVIEGDMTEKEMEILIKNLLIEREILINDFNDLKDVYSNFIPGIFRDHGDLNLLLTSLDEMTYNDFLNLSNKLELLPGQVLSSLMKDFIDSSREGHLPEFSAKNLEKLIQQTNISITISHQDELSISRQDLREMGVRINFNNIETLEFESDVDSDTFNSYVGNIRSCRRVRVSDRIPKLILWSKCHQGTYFQIYKAAAGGMIKYAKEANTVVGEWRKNGSKD